jgi:predicted 2-oxoglutarate/Fe(II)-dependent dioxygenase YbiX
MRIEAVDPDIFLIHGVFSTQECSDLIARAEAIGFEAASVRTPGGPQMMAHVRNNDRVVLTDPALADAMWRRIADLLPMLDGECACGVDPLLRFYRYLPGQRFKRHKDGIATDPLGRQSKLSYLIYLNDCDGGATVFTDHFLDNGQYQTKSTPIEPRTGCALLFRHARWHEGTPVTSGAKYVLRTDVFYAPT